jgi:hypothetical protein
LAVIHKAKDNSVKSILAEPELFAEFLRNFIPIDILKDVAPNKYRGYIRTANFFGIRAKRWGYNKTYKLK